MHLNHAKILRNTRFFSSHVFSKHGDIFRKSHLEVLQIFCTSKTLCNSSEVEIHLHSHKRPNVIKRRWNHRRHVCMWQFWAEFQAFFVVKKISKCMQNENHKELWWDNVNNIQHISMLRKQNNKNEKQFESLPIYFLGILYGKTKVFYQ